MELISEPILCVALIVNSVFLCFLSPRAVNINASNQCLELVFKVRLGCSRLLCLGLQNPARCRWSSSSSGSDRSPLAVGVQLPLLWGWVKPVPAQAWVQLRPGGSSRLCFMLEVAGGGLEESQTHSCFFVVIHRNCFQGIVFKWSSLSCLE